MQGNVFLYNALCPTRKDQLHFFLLQNPQSEMLILAIQNVIAYASKRLLLV
jgi:hypothetical protein